MLRGYEQKFKGLKTLEFENILSGMDQAEVDKAEEALRMGLVSKVVPVADLLKEAMTIARRIAEKPPLAVRMTKMCLRDGMQMNLSQALAYEGRCLEFLVSTEDHRERIKAFLEKREPCFSGK